MPGVRGGKLFAGGDLKPLPKASDLASSHRRVIAKWNYRAAGAGAATARANYLSRQGIGSAPTRTAAGISWGCGDEGIPVAEVRP
jgi:hypothetical protein